MSQAYNQDNQKIGDEVQGSSLMEAFTKCNELHPEADKIVTRQIKSEDPAQQIRDLVDEVEGITAVDIVRKIDTRLGDDWCKKLLTALETLDPTK